MVERQTDTRAAQGRTLYRTIYLLDILVSVGVVDLWLNMLSQDDVMS